MMSMEEGNNTDLRRTQKENDKEILIFEEP